MTLLTRDSAAFLAAARLLKPDFGPATPRSVFLITPEGFSLAEESAQDNSYMAEAQAFDPGRALEQHRQLQLAMSAVVPVIGFPGRKETPDAVFPNNVFATAPGRVVIGRMRHPVRQREAAREDIRGFFSDTLGYQTVDLSTQVHVAELTGALVIDRARGLGFIGLSERCDEEGARLMHEAFGLRASLMFDLAPSEYHTNVVLAVLAGRAAVVCPAGFAEPAIVDVFSDLYGEHVLICNAQEHADFVGNCIAVSNNTVWMSARAGESLTVDHKAALSAAGFALRTVPLDAIEAAGGSLRCCIGEIY